MPRESEKRRLERSLWRALRAELTLYAISSDRNAWEQTADILARIRAMRYLQRRALGSAGRVIYADHFDMIDQFLSFPDEGFRARFRMSRPQFESVVSLLQAHSTVEDWHINDGARGAPGRPVRKQVAVALAVLGGQKETLEKVRATFGIAKGTVFNYLWRFIIITCRLVKLLVKWPTKDEQRRQRMERMEDGEHLFPGCIGYIDGSDIVLNEKPQRDWELYYGRKSVYGFNLQAVCDDNFLITYAQITHRVSAHDSAAFKASNLYKARTVLFDEESYLLGDKAYEIDKHVITPYRQNANRSVQHPQLFNLALSKHRIRIEHTFGQIKERFQSFYSLPTHIREGGLLDYDLSRVQHWTLACICIHNFLRMRHLEIPIPDSPIVNEDYTLRPDMTAYRMRSAGEERRAQLAQRVHDEYLNRSRNEESQ